MANLQIESLLENMKSIDKDFRFMATIDLIKQLEDDCIVLDEETEENIVCMVLKLLKDKNGEVQNQAIKSLGPLVNRVRENQVAVIMDSLCVTMLSNDEQMRDIASIGLKSIILALSHISNSLARRVSGKLSNAIEKDDESVKLDALDILFDFLLRFGDTIVPCHSTILGTLVPQLDSGRQAIRKRTIVALSQLLTLANNDLFNDVVEHLLEGLENTVNQTAVRTSIQCLTSICLKAGHRLYNHIERAMLMLNKYSQSEDDDLREVCLHAYKSFIIRCSGSLQPHIPIIFELCLKYIAYDPNCNYEIMDTDTEDENSEEYSDDDDMSWKVRSGAAKCLQAMIETRRDLLEVFYRDLSPVIIVQFKEREENIKSEVLHTYIALLKNTRTTYEVLHNPDSNKQVPGAIILLQNEVPNIVNAIQPLMRHKSMKIREDCFLLLRELENTLPGALSAYLVKIMPGINDTLSENFNSNIVIDALSFLNSILQTPKAEVFYPYIPMLVPLVVTLIFEPFYKVSMKALLVLQQLIKVMRPVNIGNNGVLSELYESKFEALATQVYADTLKKLKATDEDQEVKDRTIACMGQIFANMGDWFKAELDTCLPIFLERLENEVTRLSSIKALTMMVASPLHIDVTPILDKMVTALSSFLRKKHEDLKLHSLQLLNELLDNYAHAFEPKMLHTALGEINSLISDKNLIVTQFTLILLSTMARMQPQALIGKHDQLVSIVMSLLRSPFLQNNVLMTTLDLFQELVRTNLPGFEYNSLLDNLMNPAAISDSTANFRGKNSTHNLPEPLQRQAYYSLAKCVAALTLQCTQEAIPLATKLLNYLKKRDTISDTQIILYLITIGEIGRHFDLSAITGFPETIINCFGASSEDMKIAASHALSAVSVENLQTYLEFILKMIDEQPKEHYVLLHSLKEVISSLSTSPRGLTQLLPSTSLIWQQLFKISEHSDEGTRNIAAECLCKLVLANPDELLPLLEKKLLSENPLVRTVVISTIKFAICDQPQQITVQQNIGKFLFAMSDPEPSVRRVALVAFNSAIHKKLSKVRDLLPTLLPLLYSETKVKKELIYEVEMGPFKHIVDDGLNIRKAAFECMYTLLEQGLENMDIMQFLDHMYDGLYDHYDIKMLTYLMMTRLAVLFPDAMLLRMDKFVQQLRDICYQNIKPNSILQDYEKQNELKRSALRAVLALAQIPNAYKNQQLVNFLISIKSMPILNKMYRDVQKNLIANSTVNIFVDQN